jgi:hypothetical protein
VRCALQLIISGCRKESLDRNNEKFIVTGVCFVIFRAFVPKSEWFRCATFFIIAWLFADNVLVPFSIILPFLKVWFTSNIVFWSLNLDYFSSKEATDKGDGDKVKVHWKIMWWNTITHVTIVGLSNIINSYFLRGFVELVRTCLLVDYLRLTLYKWWTSFCS